MVQYIKTFYASHDRVLFLVFKVKFRSLTPSTPAVSNWCCSKGPAAERQSARMSKIKNGGLDQYGAEPFEQHQFGTAGVERVKVAYSQLHYY